MKALVMGLSIIFCDLFTFLDAHRPWRKVKVTDSRAAVDSPPACANLPTFTFPDNLSTHSAGALYQAFPAGEARRVLRRLEFARSRLATGGC